MRDFRVQPAALDVDRKVGEKVMIPVPSESARAHGSERSMHDLHLPPTEAVLEHLSSKRAAQLQHTVTSALCKSDQQPEVIRERLQIIDAVLHGEEGSASMVKPLRVGAQFLDLVRICYEWPQFAAGCVQRLLQGKAPLPSATELGDWLKPVLPALIGASNTSVAWNAGHLAWHLRDHGGVEMVERAGHSIGEFAASLSYPLTTRESLLMADIARRREARESQGN